MRWESTTGLNAEQLGELVARCGGLSGAWDIRTWATVRLEFGHRGRGDRGGAAEEPGPGGGRGCPEHQPVDDIKDVYFRPVVAAVLTEFVPDVATVCAGEVPLVDGTLVPTGGQVSSGCTRASGSVPA